MELGTIRPGIMDPTHRGLGAASGLGEVNAMVRRWLPDVEMAVVQTRMPKCLFLLVPPTRVERVTSRSTI